MRKSSGDAAALPRPVPPVDAETEGEHEAAIPPGLHLSLPPKLGSFQRPDPALLLAQRRTFLDSACVCWIKTSIQESSWIMMNPA